MSKKGRKKIPRKTQLKILAELASTGLPMKVAKENELSPSTITAIVKRNQELYKDIQDEMARSVVLASSALANKALEEAGKRDLSKEKVKTVVDIAESCVKMGNSSSNVNVNVSINTSPTREEMLKFIDIGTVDDTKK